MDPDEQDGKVDWQYPDHQHQDAVTVVVEADVGSRPLEDISKVLI